MLSPVVGGLNRRRRVLISLMLAVAVGLFASLTAQSASAQTSAPLCPGSQTLSCEQLVELGLTYPYAREPGSYLFVNGVAYPYVRVTRRLLADSVVAVGDRRVRVSRLLARLGLAELGGQRLTPVLAYGSNANVDALTRKYLTPDFPYPTVIPVLTGRIRGYDVAWSPNFSFNGSLPATIAPSPGTTARVWVNWLNADQLQRMNATESVGQMYALGRLRAPLSFRGPPVRAPLVYVDCAGALKVRGRIWAIAAVRASARRFAPTDAAGALRLVAPTLGWKGSVFELILTGVADADLRAARTARILDLGRLARDRRFTTSLRAPPALERDPAVRSRTLPRSALVTPGRYAAIPGSSPICARRRAPIWSWR